MPASVAPPRLVGLRHGPLCCLARDPCDRTSGPSPDHCRPLPAPAPGPSAGLACDRASLARPPPAMPASAALRRRAGCGAVGCLAHDHYGRANWCDPWLDRRPPLRAPVPGPSAGLACGRAAPARPPPARPAGAPPQRSVSQRRCRRCWSVWGRARRQRPRRARQGVPGPPPAPTLSSAAGPAGGRAALAQRHPATPANAPPRMPAGPCAARPVWASGRRDQHCGSAAGQAGGCRVRPRPVP
mmetsp:Transcript_149735/g.417345  ORF Transcript_149735/g.417345 Transcript_149735/m.417345 type:complete len:242 (+) Transcript_149735:1117-1842(+)